jgi:peroxiredoxin
VALTASTMLPLGTALPAFELPAVAGGSWSSSALDGRPVLVLFICAHCPYVKHVEASLTALEQEFSESVQIIAISSNSVITHPQDAPEHLLAQQQRLGWRFPYLHDPDQAVAKAFHAACTPDPFLFDGDQRLIYRGQLDATRPGGEAASDCADLCRALAALQAGQPPLEPQHPAMGCNIKWHAESP